MRRSLSVLLRGPGARAFSGMAFSGVGTKLLLLISAPIVARMLGVEGRGQLAFVLVVALVFSQLVISGVPIALARELARTGARGREVLPGYGRQWALLAVVGGIGAAAATSGYFVLQGSGPQVGLAVVAFTIAVVASWNRILVACLQGEHNARAQAVVPVIAMVAYVLAIAAHFVVDRSSTALGIAGIYVGTQVLGTLLAWRAMRPKRGVPVSVDRRSMRRVRARSWATDVGILRALDQIVVALALNPHALGLYVVAVSTTNVALIALQPVAGLMMPRLVAVPAAEFRRMMVRWLGAALALTVAVSVLLQIVIDPVIRVFFGVEFAGAVPVARVTIIACALMALRSILVAVLLAQGSAGRAAVVEVASAAVMVVTGSIAASTHGLVGVAWATVLSSLIAVIATAAQIRWTVSGIDDVRRAAEPGPTVTGDL